MLTEFEVRRTICEIGKRLYAKGYVAAKHGNISYKYSNNEYFCTPSGVSKVFLTPDKIVNFLAVCIHLYNFVRGKKYL